MSSRKVISLIMAACFTLCLMATASTAMATSNKLFKLNTAWMPEYETFLMWYAKNQGWDKEEGLDIQMLFFNSGPAELEALPSHTWAIGIIGGLPGVIGHLRNDVVIIGEAMGDAMNNVVMLRPDDPILKVKGWNPKYPDIYGSPDTIKGREVLVTTVTTSHMALIGWLKAFDLGPEDIIIKNMECAQQIPAFDSDIGDINVLFDPYTFMGVEKHWPVAASGVDLGIPIPMMLTAEKRFCNEHPEIVAKFLRVYLRAVNMMQQEDPKKMVPHLLKYYKEWAGLKFSENMALMDITRHPLKNLDQQLAFFDTSKGESGAQMVMRLSTEFLHSQGQLTDDEFKRLQDTGYATDKFLKMVEKPIPGD